MDVIEFYSNVDDIEKSDIKNGFYMEELLGDDYYPINELDKIDSSLSYSKAIFKFNKYGNDDLMRTLCQIKPSDFLPSFGKAPYCFDTKMLSKNSMKISPTVLFPDVFDKASYAFFGHQFHHLLKDKNVEEIKIRNRVSDVIPLFYELMCADDEDNKLVAKEIIKRRIFLLQLEKRKRDDIDTLQLFNSYYYALGLFLKYKKDDLIVLRLISRVLMGEITTLELLTMLNLYEEDLDYEVSRQLETIKQNILR